MPCVKTVLEHKPEVWLREDWSLHIISSYSFQDEPPPTPALKPTLKRELLLVIYFLTSFVKQQKWPFFYSCYSQEEDEGHSR